MHKRNQILTLLLITAVWSVKAGPVIGAGENLEAIAVHASGAEARLLILAGRRPPGQDSGSYSEVGVISTTADGGAVRFVALPALSGTWVGDFQFLFTSAGDLYFAKAQGIDAIRVGRLRDGRIFSEIVKLPEGMRAGDLQVRSLLPREDGRIEMALRVAGRAEVLTLQPDFSITQIQSIPASAGFQSILRLPKAERFVISEVEGPGSLVGKYSNHVTLRGADMSTVLAETDVTGLMTEPVASMDGNRVAFTTRVAIPGSATAHLFQRDLKKIRSLTIVERSSYPWPVKLLLSNSRLVTLHAEERKCVVTVADSNDGRVIGRHILPMPEQARCVTVSGAINAEKIILVSTYSTVTGGITNSTLVTHTLPVQ